MEGAREREIERDGERGREGLSTSRADFHREDFGEGVKH